MERNILVLIFLTIEMYDLTTKIINVFIEIGQLRLVYVGTIDPWIFVERKDNLSVNKSSSETNSLLRHCSLNQYNIAYM